MTTEDFYAPARLGFSMFIAHVFDDAHEKFYVLVSRVLEKRSIYAQACFQRVYEVAGLPRYRHCVQWSDGPRQFKSLEIPGSSLPTMQAHPQFWTMSFNFGAPCHWKGAWDVAAGNLNGAINAAAAVRRIEDTEGIVTALQSWIADVQAKHPAGTRWHVEFFMPKPKSQYAREVYTSASVGGRPISCQMVFNHCLYMQCTIQQVWTAPSHGRSPGTTRSERDCAEQASASTRSAAWTAAPTSSQAYQ